MDTKVLYGLHNLDFKIHAMKHDSCMQWGSNPQDWDNLTNNGHPWHAGAAESGLGRRRWRCSSQSAPPTGKTGWSRSGSATWGKIIKWQTIRPFLIPPFFFIEIPETGSLIQVQFVSDFISIESNRKCQSNWKSNWTPNKCQFPVHLAFYFHYANRMSKETEKWLKMPRSLVVKRMPK